MLERLLVRGQTSGREDDNAESIKKRFSMTTFFPLHVHSQAFPVGTYKIDTMPVIEYYSSQGKVAEVDASGSIEVVHTLSSQVVHNALAGKYSIKD